MRTMRRVIVRQDGIGVEVADIPVPEGSEVLVRSVVVGVCGSDTHAAHGSHPFVPPPYFPGHEVVGVVEAVDAAMVGIRPGQRVTVEPFLPCWHCKMCISGRQNLCEKLQFFGCGYTQGGMATYFTLPADRLHIVPDELDDHTAVLIEPLATPVHAVRVAGDVAGKTVAILGAGTIGLLVLAVCRAHGAARIVVTDVVDSKRARAVALGADAAVDAMDPNVVGSVRAALGESADVVFDCVATESTVTDAIAIADKGGTVVIVGVPAGKVTIPLPMIQDHQLRIQGSATYLPEDFAESIDILRRGIVRAADIVTAIRPMELAAEAFALSASGHHIKVLVSI